MVLGRDTPWEIESNPPNPSPLKHTLEEPLAFKLLDRLVPCYKPNVPTKESLEIEGEIYEPLFSFSIGRIRKEQAFYVLAQATFPHDKLNFGDFREIGLAKFISYQTNLILSPNVVYNSRQITTFSLEVYSTFEPVTVSPPTVQKFSIIRPFL